MIGLRSKTKAIFLATLLLAGTSVSTLAGDTGFLDAKRRWNAATVNIALSSSLLNSSQAIKAGADAELALRQSLTAWLKAGDLDLRVSFSDLQNVSDSKSRGDGINLVTIAASAENIALFPKAGASAPAITRTFFDRRGNIVEADIVLNPFVQFSTDGSFGTYDLQTVLTHEIGHLLGLPHSKIASSTMFASVGMNGVSTNSFYGRTLSLDDIAATRRIYGPSPSSGECCGSAGGQIAVPRNASAKVLVWAEEAETGRIAAHTIPDETGTYSLEGLADGEYRLFAQGMDPFRSPLIDLGTARVPVGESAMLKKAQIPFGDAPSIDLLGQNGQLLGLPAVLEPGGMFRLFFGGHSLDAGSVTFGFNSEYIEADGRSIQSVDYGVGTSALAVNVRTLPNTPPGEYGVYVQNFDGRRRHFVGGIVVE